VNNERSDLACNVNIVLLVDIERIRFLPIHLHGHKMLVAFITE